MADLDLLSRLESSRPIIRAAEVAFVLAAGTNTLYALPSPGSLGDLTSSEHKGLYDSQLSKAGRPARSVYDQIKMAAPNGICPLCGRGAVYSLDHHLAKTIYPTLAIVPLNLIPACQDCNKNKLAISPSEATDETLHPYFDDVDGEVWLFAEVVEGSPAGFVYRVIPPASWSAVKHQRVTNHLRIFKLRPLFSAYAGQEMVNIRQLLTKVGDVRQFLLNAAESHRVGRRNSWQAAAYSAMAASDWFCAGGYQN